MRRTKMPGVVRVDWAFTFAAAALQPGAGAQAHRSRRMTNDPNKQWRIDNARHLWGVRLQLQHYTRSGEHWDHDHCAACRAKFAEFNAPDIQHEGYATCADYPKGARYEWVCSPCFADLKDEMQWSAVDNRSRDPQSVLQQPARPAA
jgi:hypothetical protein